MKPEHPRSARGRPRQPGREPRRVPGPGGAASGSWSIQSDDLAADVAAMREPRRGRGRDPSTAGGALLEGQEPRWRAAFLGPREPLPIFFIQHLTPLVGAEGVTRPAPAGSPEWGDRGSNGSTSRSPTWPRRPGPTPACSGCPRPRVHRGAVIKADMAVFDLGPTGLYGGPARPARPGGGGAGPPRARALSRCSTARATSVAVARVSGRSPRPSDVGRGRAQHRRARSPGAAGARRRRVYRVRGEGVAAPDLPGLPPRPNGRRCWS